MTLLFVAVGCAIAPQLDHPNFKGVFNFIQEFQGYVSPGILAAFLVGFVVKRAPGAAGVAALLAGPLIYGLLHWQASGLHYLIRMMITFCSLTVIMAAVRVRRPLPAPRTMPMKEGMELENSPLAMALGVLVIAAVVLFFAVFW
jgi:SSS family solute:Na+ symporter